MSNSPEREYRSNQPLIPECATALGRPQAADYFVKRLKFGDDADQLRAFEEWTTLHFTQLVRHCQRCCRHEQTGEDLAQETLLQIWNRRSQCQATSDGMFYGWAFRIATRKCCCASRRLRSRGMASLNAVDIEPATNQDAVAARLLEEDIAKLVERFPDTHQDAFRLWYYGEMPYDKIARIFEKDATTIGRWIRDMLESIRESGLVS